MNPHAAIAPAPLAVTGSTGSLPDGRDWRVVGRPGVARPVIMAALLAGFTGCATYGTAAGGTPRPLAIDQRVSVEGEVAGVDTAPMAYDGNALVTVATTAHGVVTVHLPARRNLCQARGFELLDALRPGDRVRVDGLATAAGEISVCQDAADRLQRID